MKQQYKPLDFDRLAELARTKPQVLERYLRLKVNQIFARAKPEERLHLQQLQFRIDSVKRRTKTPLAACIKLSQMMHDELWQLQQALNRSTDPALKAEQNTESTGLPSSIDNRPHRRGKVVPLFRSGKFRA
mgnify:CR=1 FL=1